MMNTRVLLRWDLGLLAVLFSLSSIDGFSPIHGQTAATQTRRHPYTIDSPMGPTTNPHKKSLFGSQIVANHRVGRYQHRLNALPASFWYIFGHITLPLTGTPTVIKSTKQGGWYRKIDLPPWTPPDRLFGPVWTTLYTCMGVAVSRIAKLSSTSSLPVQLWALHFAINLSWAPVFFGLQRFRLGLIISYALLGSLAAIIPLFHSIDPTAGLLLVPYALWLSFATLGLNTSICRRNPTKNGYNEGMFQAQLIKLQEDAAAYAGV